MILATIQAENPKTESERRDGRLIVVSADYSRGCQSPSEFPTMLSALENWQHASQVLSSLSQKLSKTGDTNEFSLDKKKFMAPLPRTYAWLDGSAFIQHVILVRKARGAEPPEDLLTVPLMYQGISDNLLGPTDDIPLLDPAFGMDFESEVTIVTDRVPMGTKAKDAHNHVKLLMIMNDVSLRNLIPRELATGFGFFHSKPASAFGPFAITPDELGNSWHDGRVHLPLITRLNGKWYGEPNAGEMHFSFFDLIEHAAKTRELSPGTIIGSGTVSNKDETVGSSCLAEKRMLEKINSGEMKTPFMKVGDTVEIEMLKDGVNLFGKISQRVVSSNL